MRQLVIITLFFLLLSPFTNNTLQADEGPISLTTTLVNIDKRQRLGSVILANPSSITQRYRISLVDQIMKADGNIGPNKDNLPLPHSATKWVIASPSSIRLGPKKSQNIRLLVRRPKGLEAGEYRSHLLVAQQPSPSIGGLDEEKPVEGMQFKLTAVYRNSIPVVIQQGETHSSASLKKLQISENGQQFSFTLTRNGNASFRGFIALTAENIAPAYIPVTIYRERQQITRAVPLAQHLMTTKQPLKVNLYHGVIPRKGQAINTESIDSHTISR